MIIVADRAGGSAGRPPVAWVPVGSAVLACVVALVVTTTRYGYHRDELYFRLLEPAWGYIDQPPLTPMLARAAVWLFGDSVWAVRVPATLCVALAVLLVALTARELGGGRDAQTLAAWGSAFCAFPLVVGHILLTATVDLPVWAAVLLFVTRALVRDQPRWWLAAGVVVGLSLYNKLLIVVLLLGIAIGLLAVGPRRVFRSPWLWAGVGVAVLLGAPNLVFQATHDWPQAQMAGALSRNKGSDARVDLIPLQILLIGLPLVPICVAGLVALLRRAAWRPVRALAVAYLSVLVIVFAVGGQPYYPFGLLLFAFAAGCVPTVDWMARGVTARRVLVVGAVVVNAAVTVLLALPVLPENVVGATPIPEINQGMRDQVGWPTYAREVADVYHGLPAADRDRAVLLTSNYGEAGALARYGPELGLPATVYSGHNELIHYGPPPEDRTVVVAWGLSLTYLQRRFTTCEQKATTDNRVGVDNEEQGRIVAVCRDPIGGWGAVWPKLAHLS